MVGKFRMVTCNCGVTLLWRIQRYTSGTLRLLMSRQSARCCWLCAWQGADSSLSPSSSGGESKRGRDVYDGWEAFFFFFFKGKHHRTPDGRDPNRDICDVMRQTGTYFSHVEMSGRGSLSGADGTITLLSQGGIHRGAEKSRDSGADQALWSWVSCQLGSFLDKRNTDIRWKHI